MPQHYLTPRESRRLLGRATITYGGILAGETFPDTMIVCRSNFDIKGLATSALACCGVVSSWRVQKTFAAAIPYRAILPPTLDNLLVAGRAYSASHDALALARMQRDMLSLGAAAGLAAAMSAASGVPLPNLDLAALQAAWLSCGVILPRDQRRFARAAQRYGAAQARRDAAALLARGRDHSRLLARLMRSTVSVKPLLAAFRQAKSASAKEQIARALCYLGDTSTVPFLLQTIERQIRHGLPRPLRKTLAVPPEHGWAGAPAYSLWAIAISGAGRQAAGLMTTIARMIPDNADLFASKRDSPFEYVRAICAVAERCPGPAMIPALAVLLEKDCLRGQCSPQDGDPRKASDRVAERLAYLELCIGRALARCADPRGYDILAAYADDARGPLARGARRELAVLLGKPVPARPAAIKNLCARSAAVKRPRPLADILP